MTNQGPSNSRQLPSRKQIAVPTHYVPQTLKSLLPPNFANPQLVGRNCTVEHDMPQPKDKKPASSASGLNIPQNLVPPIGLMNSAYQQQQQQQLWMMQTMNRLYSDSINNSNSNAPKVPTNQNSDFTIPYPMIDTVPEFVMPQYSSTTLSTSNNNNNINNNNNNINNNNNNTSINPTNNSNASSNKNSVSSSSTVHLNSGFDLTSSVENQGPLDTNLTRGLNMKNIQEVDEESNSKSQQGTDEISVKTELLGNSMIHDDCINGSSTSLAGLPHVITNKKDSQDKLLDSQLYYNLNLSGQLPIYGNNPLFINPAMSSMIGNNFDIPPPPSFSSFAGVQPDLSQQQPFMDSLANCSSNNSQFEFPDGNANNSNIIQQQSQPFSVQPQFLQSNNQSMSVNISINNFTTVGAGNMIVPPSGINYNVNTNSAATGVIPNYYYPPSLLLVNNESNNAPSSSGSDFSSVDTISPISERSSSFMISQHTSGKSKKQHRRRNTDPSSSSVAKLQHTLLSNNAAALYTTHDARSSFSSMSSVSSTSPTTALMHGTSIPGKLKNGKAVDSDNLSILTCSSSAARPRSSSNIHMGPTDVPPGIIVSPNGRSMSFTGVSAANNNNIMVGDHNNDGMSQKFGDSASNAANNSNSSKSASSTSSSANLISNTGTIMEGVDSIVFKPKNLCPHCSKPFKRPSSLQTHIYTHTGEKPFVCTWPGCNKWFSVRSNMIRHSKLHERDMNKDLNKDLNKFSS